MSYCGQTVYFFRGHKGRGHIRANPPIKLPTLPLPPLLKVTCCNSQKELFLSQNSHLHVIVQVFLIPFCQRIQLQNLPGPPLHPSPPDAPLQTLLGPFQSSKLWDCTASLIYSNSALKEGPHSNTSTTPLS